MIEISRTIQLACFWLVIAWLLNRAQHVASRFNYGQPWNGLGAVLGVLERNTYAPMIYRVLVPWLMAPGLKLKFHAVEVYEIIKIVLMAGALWSVQLAWGWGAALLTAILISSTFLYDYWDCYAELIGINLALTGDLRLALVGVVVHALSRETAILSPIAFFIATQAAGESAILMGVCVGVLGLVRLVQGKHALYCERWMIKRNWTDIKTMAAFSPTLMGGIVISLMITLLTIGLAPLAGWSALIPLAVIAMGWTLAVAEESRVFMAALPWIANGMMYIVTGFYIPLGRMT